MKVIESPDIPAGNGHYSQVVEHQGVLYLSGQLPVDPDTKAVPATIQEQTTLVLSKLESLLTAAGSSKSQVLQTRVYVSNISLWDEVNRLYAAFFGDHKPARCIVPTRELHFGCLIEIEATAIVKA